MRFNQFIDDFTDTIRLEGLGGFSERLVSLDYWLIVVEAMFLKQFSSSEKLLI